MAAWTKGVEFEAPELSVSQNDIDAECLTLRHQLTDASRIPVCPTNLFNQMREIATAPADYPPS
jgi:hypothetical protein